MSDPSTDRGPDDAALASAILDAERVAAAPLPKPWLVLSAPGGLLQGHFEDESRARLEMRALADRCPGTAYITCRLTPTRVALVTVGPMVEIAAGGEGACRW